MKNCFNSRLVRKMTLVCAVVFMTMLFILVHAAQASELSLPAGLKWIEEQAFYGDTSLDSVVVQEGTEVIGSEAFARSSVKTVTLPGSLYFIADNAFAGCGGLTVNAQEGTYAYSWALKNGYIWIPEIPAESETRVIMPETLRAGMNLEVQVFGPVNTISHTVFLINNATKKGETRWIRNQNGTVEWEGYNLESGSYTVKVYTVTDEYSGSVPVSKDLTITGTRPAGPEDIRLPEKIGWNGVKIEKGPYDVLDVKVDYYDREGNRIDWFEASSEEGEIHIWRGPEVAVNVHISIRGYRNGIWSDWSSEKVIEITNENTIENWPGLQSLTIPDSIIEGRDFEISFELEEGINYYYAGLYDVNGNGIQTVSDSDKTSGSLIIPGYKTEHGVFSLNISVVAEIEGEYYDYTVSEQTITILEGRKPGNVTLTANKTNVYTNENVSFSITSIGTEGAYIKITGNGTTYKGCALQEDGSGICNTSLDAFGPYTHSAGAVTLSACVFLGDSWSEWSEPITINVTHPEPLPVPVITVADTYENGEDIVVSVDGVEDADYYYVDLLEYFSGDRLISRSYYKNNTWSNFGEDVVLSGSLVGSGTYRVRVRVYSSIRESSSAEKLVKVTGTRQPSPTVTCDPDEFRINQTTTFAIDTTDCEDLYLKYNGSNDNYSWSDSYSIEPMGDLTTWTYRFDNYAEDADFSFNFMVKKNGKWTASKEIRKTVLGLPSLDPAVIHVDDIIEAGKDFSITVEAVANATNYEYGIFKSDGGGYSSYYSNIGSMSYSGYRYEPGVYTVKVWAYADNYATSVSEKTFSITGTKPQAPRVTADKTEFYSNETRPVITITAQGAEAIRCDNDDSLLPDDDGTAMHSPYMYLYNVEQQEYKFSYCAVINDVWSAWSDPITIKMMKVPEPEPLDEPTIHLPDALIAGQDFSFSFDAVDGATSYEASIYHYYAGTSIYSNSSALPETDLTVSAYSLTSGRYIAKVYASAPGRTTSSSQVEFRVTGERGDAPEVTTDKDSYTAGETISFSIETVDAEEVCFTYRTSGNYSSSGRRMITPEGNITAWSYSIPSYYYGTTIVFNFYAKKGGMWTKAKVITVAIPNNNQ